MCLLDNRVKALFDFKMKVGHSYFFVFNFYIELHTKLGDSGTLLFNQFIYSLFISAYTIWKAIILDFKKLGLVILPISKNNILVSYYFTFTTHTMKILEIYLYEYTFHWTYIFGIVNLSITFFHWFCFRFYTFKIMKLQLKCKMLTRQTGFIIFG